MELSFTTAESGYHASDMDQVVRELWSAPSLPREHQAILEVARTAGVHQQIADLLAPPEPKGPHPREHSGEAIAHAIVRQSRWVVLCPWCPSAQYAHTTDRRFFCVECGNAAVGGKWVTVEWPKNPEEIELHLSVRSDPNTRSWEWGESIGDLAVENAEHGASGLVLP